MFDKHTRVWWFYNLSFLRWMDNPEDITCQRINKKKQKKKTEFRTQIKQPFTEAQATLLETLLIPLVTKYKMMEVMWFALNSDLIFITHLGQDDLNNVLQFSCSGGKKADSYTLNLTLGICSIVQLWLKKKKKAKKY